MKIWQQESIYKSKLVLVQRQYFENNQPIKAYSKLASKESAYLLANQDNRPIGLRFVNNSGNPWDLNVNNDGSFGCDRFPIKVSTEKPPLYEPQDEEQAS